MCYSFLGVSLLSNLLLGEHPFDRMVKMAFPRLAAINRSAKTIQIIVLCRDPTQCDIHSGIWIQNTARDCCYRRGHKCRSFLVTLMANEAWITPLVALFWIAIIAEGDPSNAIRIVFAWFCISIMGISISFHQKQRLRNPPHGFQTISMGP
jgi:hypothetical protein